MYALIASRMAMLTATMNKKNFPMICLRTANAKRQQWFGADR
jgi:hypothetical protein